MHKLWLKVFALFLTTAVFFASGCLDKDSKTDTGADVALPEAPEDIDGAENIKDASGRFLSLPFNDSEVEIVQGYFYTWDKVDNPTHMGIDYIKKDKNNSWLHFEVLAAADGVAMQNEHEGIGLGKYVVIRHDETVNGMHYYSLYAHLDSVELSIPNRANWDANYDQWERVSKGDSIGIAGDTGYPGDIHLHFEVFTGNTGSYQERTNNRVDPYDIKGYAKDYPKPPDVMSGSGDEHLWEIDSSKETVLEVQEINIRGNTVGNLSNGGVVAKQGDWIYFTNDMNEPNLWNIYKVRVDGTGLMRLNVENSFFINVVGEWIYYRGGNVNDGLKIYKVRTDGTKSTPLSNDVENIGSIHLVDGWIYYTIYGAHADDKLYKMRTDGTERTLLNSNIGMEEICVAGGWVYYLNYGAHADDKLYKMRTDGKERILLSSGNIRNINVVGDWIYYIDVFDGSKIYKIRTDGTERTKVNTDPAAIYINVDGGWIYYSNVDDNHKLYKIRTDGTENTQLNNDNYSYSIGIAGDWIYYYSDPNYDFNTGEDSYWQLYRIRTDGSGREMVY